MTKVLTALFFLLLTLSKPVFAEFELKVFKVGSGNCVVIKIPNKDNYEYLVIDAGYTNFDLNNSWLIKEYVDPNLRMARQSEIGAIDIDDAYFYGTKLNRRSLVDNIQGYFMAQRKQHDKFTIKTLVITHPDLDHCAFVGELFPADAYNINNIVLSGRPEKYLSITHHGKTFFKDWLEEHGNQKETKIYFTALKGFDLEKFEEDKRIAKKFTALEQGNYNLAPQMFSEDLNNPANHILTDGLGEREDLSGVLDFGPDTKISLLSVNPTHTQVGQKPVLRINYKGDESDDNAESLVIKVKNVITNRSAILTGDATGITTRRIINNYIEPGESNIKPEILLTDILLGSHHGASTYESNDPPWILQTQPQYVFLSPGLRYGHPTIVAYMNFQKSPNLQTVNRHKIILGGKKKKGGVPSTLITRQTNRAIFSTLTNGDLVANFTDHQEKSLEIQCHTHKNGNPLKPKAINISTLDQALVEELPEGGSKPAKAREGYGNWIMQNFPSSGEFSIQLEDLEDDDELMDQISAHFFEDDEDYLKDNIKALKADLVLDRNFKGILNLVNYEGDASPMLINFIDINYKNLADKIIEEANIKYQAQVDSIKPSSKPIPISLGDKRNFGILKILKEMFNNKSEEWIIKEHPVQLDILNKENCNIMIENISHRVKGINLWNPKFRYLSDQIIEFQKYEDSLGELKILKQKIEPNMKIPLSLYDNRNKWIISELKKRVSLSGYSENSIKKYCKLSILVADIATNSIQIGGRCKNILLKSIKFKFDHYDLDKKYFIDQVLEDLTE